MIRRVAGSMADGHSNASYLTRPASISDVPMSTAEAALLRVRKGVSACPQVSHRCGASANLQEVRAVRTMVVPPHAGQEPLVGDDLNLA